MKERRSENQSRRIFGRRAGEISPTMLGAILLIFFSGVGAYLTIGLQQVIGAHDFVSIQADPMKLHAKSAFPLFLLALPIAWFAGKSCSWTYFQKRPEMSGIGLGLFGGFAIYQCGAALATGTY